MRITVDVTLEADEIPLATELLQVLHRISSHIRPKNSRQLYEQLFRQLPDSPSSEAVVAQINTLLSSTTDGQEALNDLFQAFITVVFSPELVVREVSVQPFVAVLHSLVDSYGIKLRDKLVSLLVKQLSAPRPVDADRLDFFAQAETFATLTKLDLVSVSAALKTVVAMIRKPDTRCAGMTTMGKMVEIALDTLKQKCDPIQWRELDVALSLVSEEPLQYDLNYIRKNLAAHGLVSATNANLPPLSAFSTGTPASSSSSSSSLSTVVPPSASSSSLAPTSTLSIPSSTTTTQPVISPIRAPTAITRKATRGAFRTLHHKESFPAHSDAIVTMCHDDFRDHLITSSKDGAICAWNKTGKSLSKAMLTGYFACSMDMHANNTLLVAAKDTGSSVKPAIFAFDLSHETPLSQFYPFFRKDVKLISCVKSLGGSIFVASETQPRSGLRNKVCSLCLFDMNAVSQGGDISPVISWTDHEDIVTCITRHPDQENMFFTGSKDFTIRLWDVRASKPIVTLGKIAAQVDPAAPSFNGCHVGTVSSLDASGNTLVSADLRQVILTWDLRQLSAGTKPVHTTPTKSGALKVLIGPTSSTAAVAAADGLSILNLANGELTEVAAFPGKDSCVYPDLRWDVARQLLFAAGRDGCVDVYEAEFDR